MITRKAVDRQHQLTINTSIQQCIEDADAEGGDGEDADADAEDADSKDADAENADAEDGDTDAEVSRWRSLLDVHIADFLDLTCAR